MKNLIVIILLINTNLHFSFAQKVDSIYIPPFQDFDPKTFFNTEVGKIIEKFYDSEEMLQEYYINENQEGVEKIKNYRNGFTLYISKDTIGEKLSKTEFFLTLVYFAKYRVKFDKNKNPFILLSNKSEAYILMPIQPSIFYGFPPINQTKPGTDWFNWLENGLYFSKN